MRHARTRTLALIAALLACGGCYTIPDTSTRAAAAPDMDWSRVATTDGSRIVARGKPPLYFIYPGTGRLSVRDLDSNSILFSIELPASSPIEKTQISIAADGKFTGKTNAGVTDLGIVNRSHTYVITYLPAEQMK